MEEEINQQNAPPSEIPTSPEKKNRPWLIIAIIVVVLLLLGSTTIFAYQNYLLKKQVAQKQLIAPIEEVDKTGTPNITKAVGETGSWNLYTNQQYDYSIKYPPTWYLYEPETITAYSKSTVGFWPEKTEGETEGIWVTIRDDRFTYSNLDSWWAEYKKKMITPIDQFEVEEKKNLENSFEDMMTVTKTTVAGQPALRVETTEKYQSRPYISVYVITKSNEIVDINTNITNTSNPYYLYFDQILSTFTFNDTSAVGQELNTYSNSYHDVSFQHPSSWTLVEHEGQPMTQEGTEVKNTNLILTNGEAKMYIWFDLEGIGGIGENLEGTSYILDGYSLFKYTKSNYGDLKIVGITDKLNNSIGVFKVNGKIYQIDVRYPKSYTESEEQSVLNDYEQVVSTFKFSSSN